MLLKPPSSSHFPLSPALPTADAAASWVQGQWAQAPVLPLPGLIIQPSQFHLPEATRPPGEAKAPPSRERTLGLKDKGNVKYRKGNCVEEHCVFYRKQKEGPPAEWHLCWGLFQVGLSFTTYCCCSEPIVHPALGWQLGALDSCPGHPQPAVRTWTSHFSSLCISFLSRKTKQSSQTG